MDNNNIRGFGDSISSYQIYTLLFSLVVGTQVLMMPRESVEVSGTDSIWIVFISGTLVFGIVWLIGALMQKIPRQNVIQLVESMANKKQWWMGKFLALPFALVLGGLWLWITSIVTRGYSDAINIYVLPRTPQIVILISIIIASVVAVSNKLVITARITEFLLPFVYLPIPLFIAGVAENGDFRNLFPLFQANWDKVFYGVITTMKSYSGYSILFVYMAFYQQPEKSTRTHAVSYLAITFFSWLTLVSCLGIFGTWEVTKLMYPPIENVKSIYVPGGILDRVDALFVVMWMVNILTTIVIIFNATVEVMMTYLQLKEKRRKWVAITLSIIVFFLSQYPPNINKLWKWDRWSSIAEMIITVLFVGIFFILWVVRGRKKEEDHATS
ncbi:spore germination protein (amino acid permease) [Marininema mesophilum]|uniref:Spore germination protein (Amino acid permease) n=1 Tax=Marininema mesophilum TaxID=1048340 RepID=A0A1H2Q8J5_9BACL|nr:endospore germination permease [Marininema mesophilum]SDW03014.1 spore germination protein (amino acid permease) [Marininema mesophilum]